jgi:hypothetical protein
LWDRRRRDNFLYHIQSYERVDEGTHGAIHPTQSGEEGQQIPRSNECCDAPPTLTLIAIGELVEVGVKMCRRAEQFLWQLFAKAGHGRNELVVAADHAATQRSCVGDGDVGELTRRQTHWGVPPAVGGINADSDEKPLHDCRGCSTSHVHNHLRVLVIIGVPC